jgi:hypothetical protein
MLFCITLRRGQYGELDEELASAYHVEASDELALYDWLRRQLLDRSTTESPLPAGLLDEVRRWVQYDYASTELQDEDEPYTLEQVKELKPDSYTGTIEEDIVRYNAQVTLRRMAISWLPLQVDAEYIGDLTAGELRDILKQSKPGHFYHGSRSGLDYSIWDKSESFGIDIQMVNVIKADHADDQRVR